MHSGPLGEALQRQLLGHPYLHAGVVYIVLLVIGFSLGFLAGAVFAQYIEWLKIKRTGRLAAKEKVK